MSTATDTTEKLRSLEDVDAYPLPDLLIPRLIKVYGHDEQTATDIAREAKRMLLLHFLSGEAINPSLIVDDAWHEMILFTKWYFRFCKALGGYVHHTPTKPREAGAPPPKRPTTYEKTLANYEKCFGIAPDPKYWPTPSYAL